MAVEKLDITNLHRASVILKIAGKSISMKKGDILEVIGLSVTIASDVQEWCERSKKKFTFYLNSENNTVKCHIHI